MPHTGELAELARSRCVQAGNVSRNTRATMLEKSCWFGAARLVTMPPTISFDKCTLDLGGRNFRKPRSAHCKRSLLMPDPGTGQATRAAATAVRPRLHVSNSGGSGSTRAVSLSLPLRHARKPTGSPADVVCLFTASAKSWCMCLPMALKGQVICVCRCVPRAPPKAESHLGSDRERQQCSRRVGGHSSHTATLSNTTR